MQFKVEQVIVWLLEVKFVFFKIGIVELVVDLMLLNILDMMIIMKLCVDWFELGLSKVDLVVKIEKVLEGIFGNVFEISQLIQMWFNELIVGVCGDIVVKVFGDDQVVMNVIVNQIVGILCNVEGVIDVRVEQIEGLFMLDIWFN